ncbi:hypothetical protein JCM21900_004939 [Sporobolomyces salmonicolor]
MPVPVPVPMPMPSSTPTTEKPWRARPLPPGARLGPPPPGPGRAAHYRLTPPAPQQTPRADPWTSAGSALIQLVPPQDMLRLVPRLEKAFSSSSKAKARAAPGRGGGHHRVEVVAQPAAEDTFGADKWSTRARWVVLVAGDEGRPSEEEEQAALEVRQAKRLLRKWSGAREVVVLRLHDGTPGPVPGPGTSKVVQVENGRDDDEDDVGTPTRVPVPVPVFPLSGLDLVNEGAYAAIYPARHARISMNGRAWPTMALFTYGWGGELEEGGGGGAYFESRWTFERRTLKDLRTRRSASGNAQLQVRASGPLRLLQTEIRLSSEGDGTFDAEVRVVRKQPGYRCGRLTGCGTKSSPYSWTLHPLVAAEPADAQCSGQVVSLSFPWEVDEPTPKCALPTLVETWTILALEDVRKAVKAALLVIHRVRSLSPPSLSPWWADAKTWEYQVRFDVSGSGETHVCRSKLIAAGPGSDGGGTQKSAREEEHAGTGCFGGLNCVAPRFW